jgi:hypothetical protein
VPYSYKDGAYLYKNGVLLLPDNLILLPIAALPKEDAA